MKRRDFPASSARRALGRADERAGSNGRISRQHYGREFDAAIDGFTAAINVNPKLASALCGRGIAKRNKGDVGDAETDFAAAKTIKADIADEFHHYGID